MENNSTVAVDMSSRTLNAEENKAKKRKLQEDGCHGADMTPASLKIESFKDFKFKRILGENTTSKAVYIEGEFRTVDGTVVVILEKQAFSEDATKKILTENTVLKNNFVNDIYASYSGFPQPEVNGIKATVIHPATEKHIEKYLFQPLYTVKETPEIYQDVVLPHLTSQQFSLQWVYNILEHKSEVDRIIMEDPDPDNGFILLPDMKWNGSPIDDLHVIALSTKRDLKSLRDLTGDHLPLLKNILSKGSTAIEDKYGIPKRELRIFFHYQPSFYHLHVHFTCLKSTAVGISPEHAHLLHNVVNNLELMPDYYQKATLTFGVKKNDPLCGKLEKACVFD